MTELGWHPVGAILPFMPDAEIPNEWHVLDGAFLPAEDVPELCIALDSDFARGVWEELGGSISSEGITLPEVESKLNANYLMWGDMAKHMPPTPMTIAIKVR